MRTCSSDAGSQTRHLNLKRTLVCLGGGICCMLDVKGLLKRAAFVAIISALPGFVNVVSAGRGGSGSGGSGGSSSSSSSGGHSSSGNGHSASASKAGHPAGDPSGPVAMTGGRSVLATSVRPGKVPSNEVHQFSTGYVPNEQYRQWWRKHHRSFSGLYP